MHVGNNTKQLVEKWLFFSLVICIGSFLVCEIYELDVFWNLTIGRDILETMSVPKVDRYTALGLGHSYHDIHWLFQVMLALSYLVRDWIGVSLFYIGVWGITLIFCYRSFDQNNTFLTKALLIFMVAMCCIERFLPRPEIVTFIMVAFFYYFLSKRYYRSKRASALLIFLQIIWTNSHGLFVIGPFMIGCYLLQGLIKKRSYEGSQDIGPLVVLFSVAILSTLINPYGFASWSYVILLLTQVSPQASSLMKSLGELSPTFGEAARNGVAAWFYYAILALTVVVLFNQLLIKKNHALFSDARLYILLGMMLASFTGRRNIVLFALVAIPFVSRFTSDFRFKDRSLYVFASVAVSLVFILVSYYPLSGKYYLKIPIPARFGMGVTPSFFPHGLSSFLDNIGFSGQVYNSNEIGGYYMYRNFPDRIPLTEGRWTAYNEELATKVLFIAPGSPSVWKWVLDKFNIKGLLLHHSSFDSKQILPRIIQDKSWRLVYYDYSASFWLPSDTELNVREVDLEDSEYLPPPRRVDDCLIVQSFYEAVGAVNSRIVNLERILSFDYEKAITYEQLGLTLLHARKYKEAEDAFLRLLEINPKSITALNELAFLSVKRRDYQKAYRLLQHAAELDPEDSGIKENLERIKSAVTGENKVH